MDAAKLSILQVTCLLLAAGSLITLGVAAGIPLADDYPVRTGAAYYLGAGSGD